MSTEALELIHKDMLEHSRWLAENSESAEARYHARMIRYSLEDREEDLTEMFDP